MTKILIHEDTSEEVKPEDIEELFEVNTDNEPKNTIQIYRSK